MTYALTWEEALTCVKDGQRTTPKHARIVAGKGEPNHADPLAKVEYADAATLSRFSPFKEFMKHIFDIYSGNLRGHTLVIRTLRMLRHTHGARLSWHSAPV